MAEYSWFQKRDIAIISQGFCLELLYFDACSEATKLMWILKYVSICVQIELIIVYASNQTHIKKSDLHIW